MKLLDSLFRKLIQSGRLEVTWPDGKRSVYQGSKPGDRHSAIRITDRSTAWAILRNPSLGAGEGFMDGRIVIEEGDIRQLLDLVLSNASWQRGSGPRTLLGRQRAWLKTMLERNGLGRSERNVAHHYDLSDRLYDLFLDADRQYSCAYWTDPGHETLEQAQLDKKAHIAAKLLLRPGQRVLDIGCGWGGMALYLNRVADVDVLGITLSDEQLAVARRRAQEAGVADRVRFEKIDYRELDGTFDRIVSVGMFEHVGRPNYRRFFDVVGDRLAPDGVALIHSIGRAGGPGETDSWTRKYIFPGGYSPALSEIMPHVEDNRLWATDVEVLRLHYAYTLEAWYDRTVAAREQIEAIYDARFYRMWCFYLASAITAFRHSDHCNFQIQLAKQRDAVPLTRRYMDETEDRYRALDAAPRVEAAE
ncbi:MAG TPA: cyclopropane-fatty-acyl-phospholipid synthase family protein [Sphingomonas sp.]|nr:cyclopropane-fatty-acyl-phospholipid synthase family protein [Sphingomonas sp.]